MVGLYLSEELLETLDPYGHNHDPEFQEPAALTHQKP